MASLLNTRILDFRVVEERNEPGAVVLTLVGWDEKIHACPPQGGNGLTPCCDMSPFDLPVGDRMIVDGPVTCSGAS